MRILFSSIFLIIFQSSLAIAADVSVSRDSAFGEPIGRIHGEIISGDFEKVQSVARRLMVEENANKLIFELDSKGGDIFEAIKIGRLFRQLLVEVNAYGNIIRSDNTFIEGDLSQNPANEHLYFYDITKAPVNDLESDDLRKCYSACVIILLGAVERNLRDNHDQRLGRNRENIIPIIGLHRPYFVKRYYSNLSPSEANRRYEELTASLRNYLNQMGGDTALMDRMLKKSSTDVELVKKDDFLKHINSSEPFIDEWLIAKCGESDAKDALSSKEIPRFLHLVQIQKEAAADKFSGDLQNKEISISDFRKNIDQFYLEYAPNGYTKEEVRNLHIKVNQHSMKSRECRNDAIRNHQIDWALSVN